MRLTFTDDEIRSGTVVIRSVIREQADGTFTWEADHSSGWRASGTAPTAVAAQEAVEAAAAADATDAEVLPGERLTSVYRGEVFEGFA